MSYIVVIPARYSSKRLPAKPLIDLNGIPMIIRTYRQCAKAVPESKICVATDSEEIKRVCEENGIRVLITSSNCLTGTDRVAEVSKIIKVNTYINVQGDEPLFDPNDLISLVKASETFPNDVINGYCQISDEEKYLNPNIPKVVIRPNGKLLFMSRAPIPSNKERKFISASRQVCAYAFPISALEAFSARKEKTPLEEIEDIEILRFLELGIDVRMIKMSDISLSIDVSEDVIFAEKLIRQLENAKEI